MKEDRFKAAKDFLNWMNHRYPGSKNRILSRANIPISRTYMEGLEPRLGQLAWPNLPPVGTITGQPPTLPQAYGSGIVQSTLPQPEPAWWEKLADAASSVVTGYMSYKQQDKITDMQIERMKRGQPPIQDPGQYMAPTVKIAHTVDPRALQQAITPSKETQNLLWIGGALVGLVVLMSLNK